MSTLGGYVILCMFPGSYAAMPEAFFTGEQILLILLLFQITWWHCVSFFLVGLLTSIYPVYIEGFRLYSQDLGCVSTLQHINGSNATFAGKPGQLLAN